MKKIIYFFLLVIISFPLQAQNVQKVLQRVFIEQINSELSENTEYFKSVPDTLFSLITIKQPIIRVIKKEDAHTVITAAIEKKGADNAVLRFMILKETQPIDEVILEFSVSPLPLEKLQEFMKTTASKFAQQLGPVPPLVRITSLIQNDELRKTIEGIEFSQAMSKPFEISLTSMIMQKVGADGGQMVPKITAPFPVYLEFSWFITPNNGLDFSLYFEYTRSGFKLRNNPSDFVPSDAVFVMAGAGYVFRTLGRFQASFGISYSAGILMVTPESDIQNAMLLTIHNSGVMIPIFLSTLRMKIIVTYNFFENFGVFLRTGLQINLLEIIFESSSESNPEALELSMYYGRFEALGAGIIYRF